MSESALVSCEWLNQKLAAANQVILDATFFLSRQQRNAKDEYQRHIPGAQFFNIDKIADLTSSLAHTMPNAEQFSDAVGEMGIDNDTLVIIYDNNHFFAAARVWWMFRVFGHDNVRVLDGGLTRWLQLNYAINCKQSTPARLIFKAQYRSELFFDLKQMMVVQRTNSKQILDARSKDSFLGQRAQAGSGLQRGHIPASINVPYVGLTELESQTLLSTKQLRTLFEQAGVDLSLPIVTTCGTGVSAAVLALALYQLGLTEIPMYDGSWAEWGRRADTPKNKC